MNYFEEEKRKTFQEVGMKPKRKNLRELKQVGKTTVPVDLVKKALLPGKRVSITGKVYWETRKNRTDARGSRI